MMNKVNFFSTKDNVAAALVIAAVFTAIATSVFNGATARADQPMEVVTLEPIVVTAQK
jgi:hypothetical protein